MSGNIIKNGLPEEKAKTFWKKLNFGILFDVDGVIARGSTPIKAAIKGMQKIIGSDGKLTVPTSFVTNACNRSSDKAKQISEWLGTEIKASQVIHAQSPLTVFRRYHDKRVLVIGQGKLKEMATDLGFQCICTIEEIRDAFPKLDMVDHANRKKLAENHYEDSKDFQQVEAIVIFGEPNRWETNLQLLVDLLVTDGYPTMAPNGISPNTIPVLACNMDLVFMAEACMPRFGNGSFLVCLESLYKKITGYELEYEGLIGKPSEITFRYAEHCITEEAKAMNISEPITKLYFIGDNPQVDIYGINLYSKYIASMDTTNNNEPLNKKQLLKRRQSTSRIIPQDFDFNKQTVRHCEGILVETGVYNPEVDTLEENTPGGGDSEAVYHHGHRDFELEPKLQIPTKYAKDCLEAIDYILEKEQLC